MNNRNKGHHQNRRDGWAENTLGLSGIFDDFIARDLFRPSFTSTGVSTPAVNIIETADDFRVEMVAPGMRKEAFNVELHEDTITISYDHEDNRESERQSLKYLVREYNYHSFSRSFTLPETADENDIEAKYRDGILTVTIQKRKNERGNPVRQISIS
jgi:HSP20 family protein